MSLTISNTTLDEEFRATQTGTADDNDVTTATYTASPIKAEIDALTLTYVTSPTGFPQFAEKTNFVTSSNSVTDFYLTVAAGGVATTLFVGANQVFLYATSDPDIVVGRIGTGTTANPSGNVALVIGVDDSTVSSPNLWLAQYAPFVDSGLNLVDSADQLNLSGLVSLGSTFTTSTQVPFENFEGLAPGNNTFNVIFPSDGSTGVEMLITGSKAGALSTVNVSTTGIGAGSQAIDVGATLRIDTVQGMDPTTVNEANEVNNPANIAYHDLPSDADSDARVLITGADFEISQVNPGNPNERVDLRIAAFDVAGQDQGQTYLNNINSNGTAVQIDAADIKVLNGAGVDITASLTITQDGDGVIIRGLDDGASNDKTDGYQVFFTTDGVGFDRLLITNVDSTSTCDVSNFHLTVTVGGHDNESADLGAHLRFQDDGPVIAASGTAVPTLTVHDSSLGTDSHTSFASLFTTPDYGADGAGTVTYSLGVKNNGTNVVSGLFDTLTHQSIVLNYDSGTKTVIGTTVTSHDTVFTISVDASGNVNLDQVRAIQHSNTSSSSETASLSAADLVTLTATITDGEASSHNDSATATVSIGASFVFTDDGPSLTPQAVPSDNNLVLGNVTSGATSTDSSSYGLVPGGDGMPTGGYTIVGPADSSGDFQWTYNDLSHTSITETYKGSNLFSLSLASDGTYTATMLGTIASTPLPLDANNIKAGGPIGSIDVGTTGGSGDFVLITGTSGGSLGAVNASNGNVGVNNGNLDPGEALTFQLFTDSTNTTLIPLHGMDIGTKTAQSATYHITGIDHATGNPVDLGFQTVGKNGTIHVNYGSGFLDSITVAETSGSAIKIGLSGITLLTPPSDYTFNYAVQLADGDGDTATRSFTLSLDGNNDGHITSAVTAAAATLSSKSLATSTSSAFSTFDHHSMLSPLVDYHHHDYFMM